MDFSPGEDVEFVGPWPEGGPTVMPVLAVGALYTVANVEEGDSAQSCACHGRSDQPVLDLVGIPPHPDYGYCSLAFRRRPPAREQFFRSLLTPIKAPA